MPGTRYPSAEEHPPPPPFKGGKSGAKGDVTPSKEGKSGSEALGKKQYLRWEGCKSDVTIVVHSHVHY